MTEKIRQKGSLGSIAEDLFVELFCDTFGCIRVKTNVDLSTVRIDGIKYYAQDLESKLFVPERNKLIAETYLNYVKDKKTVVFCASVRHANQISTLFKQQGIHCEAVSGSMESYAEQFGWELINPANIKDKFMDMVRTMDMSFSYKPVLLKAMLEHVEENGRVRIKDIVNKFMDFYRARKESGLVVEKKSSLYCKDGYTRKDVERNIFSNPFKRFEDMRFMSRCRDIEYVEFNRHVWKRLTQEEKGWIVGWCDKKLEEYYRKRL